MKTRYELFVVLDGRSDPQEVQNVLKNAFGEDYVDMSIQSKWTIIDPNNEGDMELNDEPIEPVCRATGKCV